MRRLPYALLTAGLLLALTGCGGGTVTAPEKAPLLPEKTEPARPEEETAPVTEPLPVLESPSQDAAPETPDPETADPETADPETPDPAAEDAAAEGATAVPPVPETEAEPAAARLTVAVGDQAFTATLAETEAARSLTALLPLTLDMSELNGNEKYFYLDQALPAAAERPGHIRTGDLMLFGSDCLVLFYEDLSSAYSYTRLGALDDPTGLAEALGRGGVTVTFRLD